MRFVSKVVLACASLAISPLLHAATWVKTEDQFLQQSIQLLANAGLINTPVTTWPLMWQPILQDLSNIDPQQLSQAELHAYLRVKSAASFAQQDRIKSLALSGSSEALGQRGAGYQYQQEAMLSLGAEFKDNNWTAGLYKQFRHNAYDENSYSDNDNHWDGSYGAYTTGNWVFLAAIHQQWWGPGLHTSFNFNNQQRPVKSLQLTRLNPNLPLHQGLTALGSVQVNVQYGEFAGTAPTRHANFAAARVVFKPLSKLEAALTARKLMPISNVQLDAEFYANLLPTEDMTTVGIDFRYHLHTNTALYTEVSSQRSGQQGQAWLAGAQYHLGNQFLLVRLFAEYQQVSAQYNQWIFIQPGDPQAAIKNEWVVGAQLATPSGESGYLKVSMADSYRVALQPEQLTDPLTVQFGYQRPVFNGLLNVDYQLQRAKMANQSTDVNHAVGARWEWRW